MHIKIYNRDVFYNPIQLLNTVSTLSTNCTWSGFQLMSKQILFLLYTYPVNYNSYRDLYKKPDIFFLFFLSRLFQEVDQL